MLIAHRGIWDKYIKDNSYTAIKKGLESSKYIGIECDIRETKDNKYIIYHNALYKGNLVKNTLYKDMKDIPLLEDILKIDSNKIYLLEIKDYNMDLDSFLSILKKYQKNIYIMSFDNKVIEKLKKKNVSYKLGVLNYILNSDSNYNYDFICLLDAVATNLVIDSFKERNIEVIIYGTIKLDKNLTYIVDDCKFK